MERDEHIYKNLGGYEVVYPYKNKEDEKEPYDEFIESARKLYLQSTGGDRKMIRKDDVVKVVAPKYSKEVSSNNVMTPSSNANVNASGNLNANKYENTTNTIPNVTSTNNVQSKTNIGGVIKNGKFVPHNKANILPPNNASKLMSNITNNTNFSSERVVNNSGNNYHINNKEQNKSDV